VSRDQSIVRGARGRSLRTAAWAGALMLLSACAHGVGSSATPLARSFPLVVQNNSLYDVVVYAVPSSTESRIRIDNVTANSTHELRVPRNGLRADGTLALFVHAIGTNGSWLSNRIGVASDQVACLEIQGNPGGDISRSMLFVGNAVNASDSEDPTVPGTRGNRSSCSAGIR
jgi:hypothetical protein